MSNRRPSAEETLRRVEEAERNPGGIREKSRTEEMLDRMDEKDDPERHVPKSSAEKILDRVEASKARDEDDYVTVEDEDLRGKLHRHPRGRRGSHGYTGRTSSGG